MRLLIPALCASLALAGCQTDAFIHDNLPKVCLGVEASNTLFHSYADAVDLKPSTVALEAKAYGEAVALCNNPGADTVAAAVTVAKIGVTIGLAVLEAKRAADAAATAGG